MSKSLITEAKHKAPVKPEPADGISSPEDWGMMGVPTSEVFLYSKFLDEKFKLCDLSEGFGRTRKTQYTSSLISGISLSFWGMWKRYARCPTEGSLYCQGVKQRPVLSRNHRTTCNSYPPPWHRSSRWNRKQSNNSTPLALTNCFLIFSRVPRGGRGDGGTGKCREQWDIFF